MRHQKFQNRDNDVTSLKDLSGCSAELRLSGGRARAGAGEPGSAAVETVEAGESGDMDLSGEGLEQYTLNIKSAGLAGDRMCNERVRGDKNCPQIVSLRP